MRLAEDIKRSYGILLEEVLEDAQKWYEPIIKNFGEDDLGNWMALKKKAVFVKAFLVSINGKLVFPTAGIPKSKYPLLESGFDYGQLYPVYQAERENDIQRLKNAFGIVDEERREVVRFVLARKDAGLRNRLTPETERLEGLLESQAAALYLKCRMLYDAGEKETAAVEAANLLNHLIEKTEKLTYSELSFYAEFVRQIVQKERQVIGKMLVNEIECGLERLALMKQWTEWIKSVRDGIGLRDGEIAVVENERGERREYLFYDKAQCLREHIWPALSSGFGGPVTIELYNEKGEVVYGEEGAVLVAVRELSPPFEGFKAALYFSSAEMVKEETESRTRLVVIVSVLGLAAVVSGATVLYMALLRRMIETKRKSDFVSNISHELKTPLTTIRMYAETLAAGRYRDDKEKQRYLDIVTQQTEKLGAMIDRLLKFSRMERGIISYNFSNVRLNDFIDSVVYEFKLQNKDEDVRLHLTAPDTAVDVRMDMDAMKEAILNILNNAVKYTVQTPKDVFFNVSVSEENLIFEVKDKGIGIPKWAQKKVFDQFFRVEDRERKVQGAGLGLAIAKRAVEAHKGRIELQSEVGKGSIFRVVLPILQ
jgi:signal transduction histidine kinase